MSSPSDQSRELQKKLQFHVEISTALSPILHPKLPQPGISSFHFMCFSPPFRGRRWFFVEGPPRSTQGFHPLALHTSTSESTHDQLPVALDSIPGVATVQLKPQKIESKKLASFTIQFFNSHIICIYYLQIYRDTSIRNMYCM